jgi:hypothetical protein
MMAGDIAHDNSDSCNVGRGQGSHDRDRKETECRQQGNGIPNERPHLSSQR